MPIRTTVSSNDPVCLDGRDIKLVRPNALKPSMYSSMTADNYRLWRSRLTQFSPEFAVFSPSVHSPRGVRSVQIKVRGLDSVL